MYRTTLMLTLAALVAAACGTAVSMSPAPVATESPSPATSAAAASTPSPMPSLPTALTTPAVSPTVDSSPSPTPSATTSAPTGAGAQIEISTFMFNPIVLEVQAGTTVQWTNLDPAGHTVTSGPSDEPDGLFDSGVLEQGDSFSFRFMEPGSYEFYCDLHPRMTGQIEVGP